MARFGFVGSSYTAQANAIADEEAINLFAETNESGSPVVDNAAYGGKSSSIVKSFLWTPGLKVFANLTGNSVQGQYWTGTRLFGVANGVLWETAKDGTTTNRGAVTTDDNPASICANSIQLLIISAERAYCYTLATNVLLEVTDQMAGVPLQCDCSDTYGIVIFKDSNKFQLSQVLDFATWPGQLVNEVSVFAENITSLIVNHRELWIFGCKRAQPYQDTGSLNVFDVIQGALLETGSAATFAVSRVDNSVFCVGEDERGALIAWRSNGYTPSRISTHAVEVWLSQQANIAGLTAYSYQDRGHLFWVLYVPGGDCTWVYDVGETMWHKRAAWVNGVWFPHWSWNHVYAFGKHLVGDWNTGNVYDMSPDYYDDNETAIRRLRRSPTVTDERSWIYHVDLTVDFRTGLGPQPPLLDGDGNHRPPQAMLRWSDDRGQTWSNQHVRNCGFAGEYNVPVHWMRLGRSRNRVYELSMTDPIPWTICDAFLTTA